MEFRHHNHKPRVREEKRNQVEPISSYSPAFPFLSSSPSPSLQLTSYSFTSPSSPVMGRTGVRLPGFCLNKVATRARVRSPPSTEPTKANVTPPIQSARCEPPEVKDSNKSSSGKEGSALPTGRRIMIVADSSPEANSALQWALSHTVQNHDTIILFDVVKPSKHQGVNKSPKDYRLLNSMKKVCQLKRPEVQVELSLVEGRERGPTIVEEARKQEVSLLVLGQKQRAMTWRLLMLWAGNRMAGGGGIVDYCVQNATCMTLAVRRKSKRGGGYLITTRRHKDFWLLA